MLASAESGDATFFEDVEASDAALYLKDIGCVDENHDQLLSALN
jgi:hypothetical protein